MLVILIAAMLVAAMAAGVFFETTGFLSGKTTSTSGDVSDQLNGRVEIVAVTGQVHDGSTVEVVNVTVKRAGGSSAVDLRNATIQWVGPATAETLIWAGKNTTGPTFGITMVGGDGPTGVLDDPTDRATITLDPGTAIDATTTVDGQTVDVGEIGPGLESSDHVALDIVTDATTNYRIRVPPTLRGRSTVGL